MAVQRNDLATLTAVLWRRNDAGAVFKLRGGREASVNALNLQPDTVQDIDIARTQEARLLELHAVTDLARDVEFMPDGPRQRMGEDTKKTPRRTGRRKEVELFGNATRVTDW